MVNPVMDGVAGKLDAASQRRAKLLQDHKAVKTQLQTLDKAATAGPAAAAQVGAPADSVPPEDSPPRGAPAKACTVAAAEASDRAAASDRDSGGEDDPATVEARKAEQTERQKQQRALHQRRRDICAELDRTKAAVRPFPGFPASLPAPSSDVTPPLLETHQWTVPSEMKERRGAVAAQAGTRP